MRSKSTFSILFWLYTKRSVNGKSPVYARITLNGKRASISLKQKANNKTWDSSKQRSSGRGESDRALNHYLDQAHARLVQIYNLLLHRNEQVSSELLKSIYLGEHKEHKTLEELFSYHSSKMKNTLAEGTIRNFKVSTGYVRRFISEKYNRDTVFLSEIDFEFISSLESYLHNYWPKGHPKAMSQNTVMKHLQRFKKIITLAYHLEWIERNPFARWKPKFTRTNREFLSQPELVELENYNFLLNRLDRVRDLFIFSCYTGISYADLVKLTHRNIQTGLDGKHWIYTERGKTKVAVKIPILPKAREIINKYDEHPITEVTGTLLPVITNEKLNLYLKEVAAAVGIEKNLTFHMARHTFATTVTLANGVPIETISKLLGHTKIATTQIYARVLERRISEDMNTLEQKILNQRRSNKPDNEMN